ncbi:ATP-grasp domain-containing protein [Pleomorphovibrio marinus]|uniref:hypothetical protein n=1 Tax=Pleomorphovibrio marinus TaxID=2164132 RepID=UPI000E0C3EEE|nr:hypothetical protein [Pleomorphovibrio marinus]
MNILITGIGGPTPRSIAHRLRSLLPEAKLVGVDINHRALGFYIGGLVDYARVIPSATHKNYWNSIQSIIHEFNIDFAFVQPEQEVLAWGKYFKEHGEFPCSTFIPPVEHTEALINKARMGELLNDTIYIPKTITINQESPKFEVIDLEIGFPCWVRASVGSGGLGSLKVNSKKELEAWLFIHKVIPEFTVSEYLTGRHLANQMMYIDGEMIKNAGLHCAEYVMADIAPSKVTGNTSFGRFINEDRLLEFCEQVMLVIQAKTGVKAHGVYSFDLKEDSNGRLFVTEINIRHMAYTGIMGEVGFDLVMDSVYLLTDKIESIKKGRYSYEENFIFLRDVDENPIILKEYELIKNTLLDINEVKLPPIN